MIENDELNREIPDIQQEKLEEAVRLLKEMETVDKQRGYDRIVKPLRQREKRLRIWRRTVACAAMVLPLVVGTVWLTLERPVEISVSQTDLVVPGGKTARLILGNHEEVLLDTLTAPELYVSSGVSLRREGKGVAYRSQQHIEQQEIVYNKLIVPRGGEYDIILEDGTHVWLNADSKLRYPTVFAGKERRVQLDGEAYFEVARDTARPFFVETSTQNIQVLGTSFNVYAYSGEPMNYTTLVRGSVRVQEKQTGGNRVLVPGQQVSLNVANGEVCVQEVDVQKETGWKDGLFVFNNQNLEQIMAKLARWYDVTVFYQHEEAKKLTFKGNLPRYSDFNTVLEVLQKSSNVIFGVQNRVVIVKIK